MAYTVLNESLQVKGKLTLNNGQGSTAFFSDTITQQLATDNSSDPTNSTAMAFNEYDKQGNAKQWGHSLTISVEATDLGASITTNDYLMYFDDVNNHYYLMKVITAETDRNSGFVTISGINTAIYELGKQIVNAETTFKQANLQTVVNGLYKNAPFSVIIQDDLTTVIDYTVSANTSLQAVLQDLQTKYNVDVDSWIELDESGNISDRIIYFGHIGGDNGELIRYGGAKGFENINAQELSDTIYTKLYVTGLTDDKNPTKGHIGSVNNGMEYILDDDANAKQYAIGAGQQQPVYLEGSISNTLLSEPQALLTWAKAQMGIFNHPRFNYTVTPLHDQVVSIGDTIAVQDFHIKPEILVTSKVIQKSTSFSSPETNTFVLGEFSSIFTENANKGAGVIQLIKKDVTVVQEAADNARVSAEAAHEQALQAQQAAINAQTTADGKLVAFTVDSIDDLPATANEGDIAWVTLSDGTYGYTYLKGKWVEDINPTLAKNITDGVTSAVNQAKANSTADIKANNDLINQTINTVSKQQANNEIDKRNFDTKAQSMVDKGVADAKANTQTVAQQTLSSANANLATAQAQIEAAYKSADGIVSKKIDDTATSIGTTINQNKTDANNGISVAQSTAQQALDGLKATVSKSDYDAKTKDLTTKVGTAQLTADQATTTIGNYQKSNDGRVSTAETNIKSNKDAIALTATKQDLNSATSTLNTSIGAVNVKADSVTQTVTSLTSQVNTLGQTNQIHNSQLTPDFSGWHTGSPWGKPLNNEFTKAGVSDSDPYGAAYVYHDYATSGEWIYSDPVDVASKSKVSIAITAAVIQAFTAGVPLALYVSGYDNARKKVTSTGYNIPVNQLTGNYTQFKLENISLDNTVSYVSFTLAWNNTPGKVYMGKPMMVFAPTVGSYVPGSYNNNDKIALQQITIDGITQTVSTQGTNIDSVTKRVQTAEGNLSTATNRITGVESKQTQLSGQFNQEVTDRKNGDSTTLSQAATYTQSQVSSATSGLNSTITQTANAIIANIGASNLFPNSEFTADYGYRSKSGTIEIRQNQNIDNKISGVITIVSTAASYQGYWASNIPVIGGQKYSGATRVHYTNGGLSNGRASLDIWYVDSSGARINGGTGGSWKVQTPQIDSPYWIDLYFDGITAPINASYMQASLIVNNAGAGQTATFTQTTITATDVHQPYTPNDGISATLALFKDNWNIGIKDNIQGIVSGIVGTPTQMSLISKNITLDGNTTVLGSFTVGQANIANGAIGTAQIGDATINNAKIANLDASKISSGTIDTNRLNVSQIFAQGISTTNATIGQTLALSAGGKITAPLNGQVWDFAANPYYYANLPGKAPWYTSTQSGNLTIDTSGTLTFSGTITAPDVKIGNTIQTAYYTQQNDGSLGGTNSLTTNMSFGLNGLRIDQDDARGSDYGTGGYVFITGHGIYTGYDQVNPRFSVNSSGYALLDSIGFTGGYDFQTINSAAVGISKIWQGKFNNTPNLYMDAGGYARIAPNGGANTNQALYVQTEKVTTGNPIWSGNMGMNAYHSFISQDNGDFWLGGGNGSAVGMQGKAWKNVSLASLKENFVNVDPEYALGEILKTDIRSYNFKGDKVTDNYVSPIIDDVEGKLYIPKDFLDASGKAVKTYSIDGYLIQAIKALQEQIIALKAS
ncbi:hypothetical protein [Leuconostoc gasicomitatum]|uniref:hypothetical protein n=1 Tax=Leuconostoc gasicomitatum TaxID=115778 RepID=UPI0007E00EA4|nr:hypothetical protein [Leuconostoc gasicomitatum]CUW06530.1 hypothetical protein PB1E_0714 [Leuconostoc gasicomitatum]